MNRSLVISLVMAVVATLWILSGSLSEEAPQQDAENDGRTQQDAEATNLFRVTVERVQAQEVTDRIDLQGEIEADRNIELRVEVEGKVTKLLAQKGQRLDKGQPILRMAMNDRQAKLAKAQADLKVAEAELKSGLSLKSKNLLSENQHQQNLADVMSAKAALSEIELEIEHTALLSPFSGLLNDVSVELGDFLSTGSIVANLVDDRYLTINADVPQQHVAKLSLGQLVEARLLSGSLISGEISYISSAADTATRSFRIEARADNKTGIKRFGQSARVSIFVGQQLAHKMSPSLLSLNSEGGLQVKGIDSAGLVSAYPVEILRSENDGVWLTGLPQSFDLITVGQGFVSVGERVEAVMAKVPELDSGATL
jgi:membrane fusion protein, multidrug efflux system